jgi:CubicO group peptidase (beta-lactamase class C family)
MQIATFITKFNLKAIALLLAIASLCIGNATASESESGQVDNYVSFPAVVEAMQKFVADGQIAGAVTLVATRDRIAHFREVGQADIAEGKPMRDDSIFWIASMTKPITATAVMMLQEEGKLSIDDPVSKYIPELANLKTPDGKIATVTLKHMLTHTSGMAEATFEESKAAKTLADLITHFAAKPLAFEPGTRWQYCQSGINTLGRIVEIVSGMPFQDFLAKRLFEPLGMKDTTFYPSADQLARTAKSYKLTDGKLQEAPLLIGYSSTDRRYPAANGGLFSTAADYARFCQMILNRGTFEGKQYLKPESVARMTEIQTGDLQTGFTPGNGWGLGWCVVREPAGVSAVLSPGTFGHGGAYGTQVWLDPEKGVAYLLMIQRADLPNSDDSDIRKAFQSAAAKALTQ